MSCSESSERGAVLAAPAALATLAIYEIIEGTMLDAMITLACPTTWRQAITCLGSQEPAEQLVGLRLVLAAVAGTPGGAQRLIEALDVALAGRDHG